MNPLLLLDVDGVLNALADDLPESGVWQRGCARSDGTSWPIVFAQEVVTRLTSWHAQGAAELQWLTTWGHDANDELRVLLGMPRLDVAGTHDGGDRGDAVAAGRPSHAAAAPSAPDPLSGRWWKHDVVCRLLTQQPDRLVIWVDDELHDEDGAFRRWAEQHPRVIAIGPDPATGLASSDLDRIQQALNDAAE